MLDITENRLGCRFVWNEQFTNRVFIVFIPMQFIYNLQESWF